MNISLKKGLAVTAVLAILLLASVSAVSAYVPQSRYSQWYNVINSYPGGSFYSPQPVASTPVYGYQDADYGGYAYGRGNNVGRYNGYRYGNYGYGGEYDPYRYDNYYNTGYNNGYNNCGYGSSTYYNNYNCGGNRIVYPQPYPDYGNNFGYYRNDPYQSSSYYPNYLSYGFEY